MNLIVVKCGSGDVYVAIVGFDSQEDAQGWLSGTDEKVVAFISFDIQKHTTELYSYDVEDGFDVISALAGLDPTRKALELLITSILKEALGKT